MNNTDSNAQILKNDSSEKIISALAGDFDLICLIDVETNKEQIFKFNESKKYMVPGWDGISNFTDRLDMFCNTVVHPDDRKKFYDATRKQTILDYLNNKKGRYSFTYRNKFNGETSYWRAQFNLAELGTTQIVAAFIDITEDYLRTQKDRVTLAKSLSIIKGLSEEYANVCYMDLSENTVENIFLGHDIKSDVGKIIDSSSSIVEAYREFVARYVHPLDQENVRQLLNTEYVRKLLANKKQHKVTYRRLYGDAYKWSEATLVKAEDAEDKPENIAIGFAEIDERYRAQLAKEQIRKEYEDALVAARDKAEEANRAKTKFLFSMSHDIRTPLNAITGFTSIAKKNISNPEKISEYLDKIESAGNNLFDLVSQVLDMSRIESGGLTLNEEPLDVIDKAYEMLSIIVPRAEEKNIAVECNTDGVVNRKVLADSARMNQLFINVLGNAVKYTPDGGRVTCTISQRECAREGYGSYVFSVADTGIGMSKEFVKTIFEPFTRENTSTVSHIEGTGLGMSIVKRLADLMGAEVDIDSEQGIGTTVTVSIELKLLDDSCDSSDKEEDFSVLRDKRVLIVEDNDMNREIATEILEEMGLVVEQAEDGDVAVEMMKTVADRHDYGYYDFVLMDIQMPRMNGYEATRAIRAIHAPEGVHVPIIALSANAFEEDRVNALSAGMDEHLGKPINIPKLCATLISFI